LSARGIAVNSLHPGATRSTRLNKNASLPQKIALSALRPFVKSAARGAATQALLAASPLVGGITGEYWSNCQIASGNPLLQDIDLAKRLWDVSEDIVARHSARVATSLPQAA
jgi:WW domain-containing oxidoreductase